MVSYAYIKIERKYFSNVSLILKDIFADEIVIDSSNPYLKISITNEDSFSFLMMRFVSLIENDLGIQTSCLIVPCFNDVFVPYLDYFKGVSDIASVFLKNASNLNVIHDANYFVSLIGKEGLDTINAYIDCNLNAKKAAETLYLHRNSFSYRLNKFSLKSGMDYDSLLTIRFIKTIQDII